MRQAPALSELEPDQINILKALQNTPIQASSKMADPEQPEPS